MLLSGYTYVVLRIENSANVKFSNIRAIIQGQPIVGGYDNPARCMAHFARTYMGLEVEPTGLAETASRCDELIAGEKRRTLSLAMEKRASKSDWLATLSEYAGCYYYVANGELVMIARKPRAVSHVITADDIIADSVELSRVAMTSVANKINVTYTKINDELKRWTSNKVNVELLCD